MIPRKKVVTMVDDTSIMAHGFLVTWTSMISIFLGSKGSKSIF